MTLDARGEAPAGARAPCGECGIWNVRGLEHRIIRGLGYQVNHTIPREE